MDNRTERQRRIEDNLAGLHDSFDEMREADAQLRALLAEQQQGPGRARKALSEASVILARIEQRNADQDEEQP